MSTTDTVADIVYVAATRSQPVIVCPDWCQVPLDEHLDELDGWEGRVVHKWFSVPTVDGQNTPALEQFDLSVGVCTLTDGAPDPEDAHGLGVLIEGREYARAEVEAILRDLTEAVRISHQWEAAHR